MRVLLDTHAFIWWVASPDLLPGRVRDAIEDRNNHVYLSLVSLWEMQIKRSLGKLLLRRPIEDLLEEQRKNDVQLLSITVAHLVKLGELPMRHKDPFDRLLAAQTLCEGLTMVSNDEPSALTACRFPGTEAGCSLWLSLPEPDTPSLTSERRRKGCEAV